MKTEEKLINTEEIERLEKLKDIKIETDEDYVKLSEEFHE